MTFPRKISSICGSIFTGKIPNIKSFAERLKKKHTLNNFILHNLHRKINIMLIDKMEMNLDSFLLTYGLNLNKKIKILKVFHNGKDRT